jgi:hypothetical protein
MHKLLSALVGVSMLGSVAAASAAEPLTEAQMDGVTAGQFTVSGPFLTVAIDGNLNSVEGLNANFLTNTFWVVSN